MFKNKIHTVQDLSGKNIPLAEIRNNKFTDDISTLKLVKFKNEDSWTILWNDISEYSQHDNQTKEDIEKEEIATFMYEFRDDFMDLSDGFIRLKEGLFFIDWENRIFKIVEWNTKNLKTRKTIINSVVKQFKKFDQWEEEEYYEELRENGYKRLSLIQE